jgi:hypothetical protein
MCTDCLSKKFQIYFDGKILNQYDILHDPNIEVKKTIHEQIKLSPESQEVTITLWHLSVKDSYPTNHPIFRRSQNNCGVMIFKNNRLIQGPIFREIYGKARDAHYGGHLVFVNVSGDPTSLPVTKTTKNDFNNRDSKIHELYNFIRLEAPAIQDKKNDIIRDKGEPELTRLLATKFQIFRKKDIERNEYRVEQQKELELYDGSMKLVNKEKIDILLTDIRNKVVTLYEGKCDKIGVDGLRQAYFYYRNLKYFSPDYNNYSIEVFFVTKNDEETDQYKHELLMLQKSEPDFKPQIQTFIYYSIT